jgi:hypothetical protein
MRMTDESPLPSLPVRLGQVIVSPRALFDALSRRPAWGGAVLLGAFLLLLGAGLTPPELLLNTMRERLLERGQVMPPGLEDRLAMIRVGGAVGASVAWVIMMGFSAGLVTVVFGLLFGHGGTLRQYLAVVSHAHLIAAASVVLILPLRMATQDAQVLLSLGSFAFFLEEGYLLRMLSLVDLFGLWAWMLVGLGVSRVGRKDAWVGAAMFLLLIPFAKAAVIAFFTA